MQTANHIMTGRTPAATVPEWYQIYFAAVLEADEWKAAIEIGHAARAIQDRLRQLRSGGPENSREIQDLNSALTYLKLLLLTMDTESEMLP